MISFTAFAQLARLLPSVTEVSWSIAYEQWMFTVISHKPTTNWNLVRYLYFVIQVFIEYADVCLEVGLHWAVDLEICMCKLCTMYVMIILESHLFTWGKELNCRYPQGFFAIFEIVG